MLMNMRASPCPTGPLQVCIKLQVLTVSILLLPLYNVYKATRYWMYVAHYDMVRVYGIKIIAICISGCSRNIYPGSTSIARDLA